MARQRSGRRRGVARGAAAARLLSAAAAAALLVAAAFAQGAPPMAHHLEQQQEQQDPEQARGTGNAGPARPVVIAHRGASGLYPEHTMPSYEFAIERGADFVECDVQLTRDLKMVCRHEQILDETTDAAERFPDRARTLVIDGERTRGVHLIDLTLAEARTLRARQRFGFRDGSHDDKYPLVTFDEFLDLLDRARASSSSSSAAAAAGSPGAAAAGSPGSAGAAAAPRRRGFAVGAYPEVKHPSWHNSLPQLRAANVTIHGLVVDALHARGYGGGGVGSAAWRERPVFLQSFELTNVKEMASMTKIPLVLLMGGWPGFVAPDTGATHEEMTTPEGIAEIARYAAGVGPWKGSLFAPTRGEGAAEAGGGAHDAGKASAGSGRGRRGREQQRHQQQRQQQQRRAGGGLSRDALGDVRLHSEGPESPGDGLGGGGPDGGSPRGRLVSTGLVRRLRAAGLQVHTYTLRDEPQFIPAALAAGGPAAEFASLVEGEGVDGLIADFPETAVDWLDRRAGAPRW